jgi:hypothetical protein
LQAHLDMRSIFYRPPQGSTHTTNRVEDLIAKEHQLLREGESTDRPWCGIALSGGGIRAATFALGVLQAFAAKDLLARIDYISSVSGGGYIASSLQWWWSEKREVDESLEADSSQACGSGPEDFPYGLPPEQTDLRTHPIQQARLSYLFNHSSYLIPGDGINVYSMLSVVVRTQLVCILTIVPLLSSIFYVIEELNMAVAVYFDNDSASWQSTSVFKAVYSYGIGEQCLFNIDHCIFKINFAFIILLFICAILPLLFVIISVFINLSTVFNRVTRRVLISAAVIMIVFAVRLFMLYGYTLEYFTEILIVLLVSYGFILGVQVGSTYIQGIRLTSSYIRGMVVSSSYWFRRYLERRAGRVVPFWSLCITLGTLPIVGSFVFKYLFTEVSNGKVISIFGVVGALSGVASAVHGIYIQTRSINPGLASKIFATVGSLIFIYCIIVVAYTIAAFCANEPTIRDDIGRSVIISGMILSVLLGLLSDLNQTGLHRFYRDRLMETFMPATSAVKAARSYFSPTADTLLLSDLFARTGSRPSRMRARPYPIINANVILTGEKEGKYKQRGGDNFILTPLFLGSQATGWQSTEIYVSKNGPLTLASAMAASGAAANGNAGYLGNGITRGTPLAALMTLLNMRLGLWLRNPNRPSGKLFKKFPTFYWPAILQLFGGGHKARSAFIELSDGGHFENLGLYELIRRRLDVIVVVDAEADPTLTMAAFVSAKRRVKEDFNIDIAATSTDIARVMPKLPGNYPNGVKVSSSAYFVCPIDYGTSVRGVLVYIKATMVADLNLGVSGFRALNPDFPHETTANQFFNSLQADAYASLGFQCGVTTIESLELQSNLQRPLGILERYGQQTAKIFGGFSTKNSSEA